MGLLGAYIYSSKLDTVLQRNTLLRALAIQQTHFGQNHPKSAVALTYLARAYHALNEHKKASNIGKRVYCILMQDPLYGPEHDLTKECFRLLKDIPGFEEIIKNKGVRVEAAQPPQQPPAHALHAAQQTFFHPKKRGEKGPAVAQPGKDKTQKKK